jgi:hypothetical protein
MIMNSMGTLRRDWLPEAILLFAIAVGVTILFAVTPLDIDTVRVFYRTDGSDHWPLGMLWPWSALYKLAPFITASLLILGLVGLLIGYLRGRVTWCNSAGHWITHPRRGAAKAAVHFPAGTESAPMFRSPRLRSA